MKIEALALGQKLHVEITRAKRNVSLLRNYKRGDFLEMRVAGGNIHTLPLQTKVNLAEFLASELETTVRENEERLRAL